MKHFGKIAALGAALLLAAGCSSASNVSLPTTSATAGYVTIPLTIGVSGATAAASTASVSVTANGFATTTSTGSCAAGSCSVSVSAPPAYANLAVTIANASGATLDTGSFSTEADDENGALFACFGCAPATVTLSANPIELPAGASATTTIDAVLYDGQGRRILGTTPFSTPITLTSSDPSATLSSTTLTSPAGSVSVSYSGASIPEFAINGTLAGAIVNPVNVAIASTTPFTEPSNGAVIGDTQISTPDELAAIPTAPPLPPPISSFATKRRPMSATFVNLSPAFPPVGNQANSNMCAVFSGVYSIMSAMQKAARASIPSWVLTGSGQFGNNDATTFSPRFTYNQRSVNGGIDDGTTLIAVLESLRTIGAVPLSVVPWNAGDSPAYSYLSTYTMGIAANYRVRQYWNLGTNVGTIKSYLAAGYPIYMAMGVDNVLGTLNASNAVYSGYDGSKLGGHAMVFVGYDDSVAGGSFIVLNSWGTTHGINGYFYLPYSFWSTRASGTEALAYQIVPPI